MEGGYHLSGPAMAACPVCKKTNAWYLSPIGDYYGNYLRRVDHLQDCMLEKLEKLEKKITSLEGQK